MKVKWVEFKLEFIDKELANAYFNEKLSLPYLEWLSYIAWFDNIVANNDEAKEEDRRNVEDLMKEKETVKKNLKALEAKMKVFKSVIDKLDD